MANKTRNFKKKPKADANPLKSIIIGVGVVLLALVAVAIIFNNDLSYRDVEHIEAWSDIETIEGTMYIYAYTETCPICQDIKQEMLQMVRDHPNTTLYANVVRVEGETPMEITGVPALLIVEDGVIVNDMRGAGVVDALRGLLE